MNSTPSLKTNLNNKLNHLNSQKRAALAQETIFIMQAGEYLLPDQSKTVSLSDLSGMREGTFLSTPDQEPALGAALANLRGRFATRLEVTSETTFAAVRRLRAQFPNAALGALNFASAKNPGGGFLGGALSQEEDLCRSSTLYLSLTQPQVAEYYAANRRHSSNLYTDHLIYSPQVSVFRGDDSELLPHPVSVDVITAPAPNAGAVASNHPSELPQLPDVLWERANRVLALAAQQGQTHLVLGAWGCGVFRNDPQQVAHIFKELLLTEANGVFEQVTFAIYDRSKGQSVLGAFRAAFEGGLGR